MGTNWRPMQTQSSAGSTTSHWQRVSHTGYSTTNSRQVAAGTRSRFNDTNSSVTAAQRRRPGFLLGSPARHAQIKIGRIGQNLDPIDSETQTTFARLGLH